MAKASIDDLHTFLEHQEPAALVAVLLELAADYDVVRRRLSRMQLADRPDKLAAGFRRTLSAWRRSTRFYTYPEAAEFGRNLEGWLDQVERELLPKDPAAAVALFEAFIEADANWFDRADDSDGAIGDAVRKACRQWLAAAARSETPPGGWTRRLMRLADGDEYGAREDLLLSADLLLDEAEMRGLVTRYEAQLSEVLASDSPDGKLPLGVFRLSGVLSLLAAALRDPDIKVRAVLRYSPEPNALQQQDFAQAYLDADRPADALRWLEQPWEHRDDDDTRQALLAQALGQLGRFGESAPILQQMFERTLSVFDLQCWLEHLSEPARRDALARARQLALDHEDPATAAILLIELDDPVMAESKLVAEPKRVDGRAYDALVPLADALRAHQRVHGETVVLRALLEAILVRGYARAYTHGARYWSRLEEIAESCAALAPLQSHVDFEAAIRARHGRKWSFWAQVNARRSG